MKVTFKGFLVVNNYQVGCHGIVVLSHAVKEAISNVLKRVENLLISYLATAAQL
jgi:hypothetical protein